MFMNYLFKKIILIFISVLRKFGLSIYFSADGEDSILNKWIGGITKGFYIDIGSNQPLYSSNTFGLYLKGWCGICIDPNPGLELKYSILRSSDLFINSAIVADNKFKKRNFYYYKNNNELNTFSKKRVNIQKKLYNRNPSKVIKVDLIDIKTLIKIINNREVHFLNIDIEGLENIIIKSLLKKKILPWCIAIEELGKTCESINKSKINFFLNKNGYFLGSRTFFTSIYIRKKIVKQLQSQYVKEII
jgi:FkbM family methyltransferase